MSKQLGIPSFPDLHLDQTPFASMELCAIHDSSAEAFRIVSLNHGSNVAKHLKRLDNRFTTWQDNRRPRAGSAYLSFRRKVESGTPTPNKVDCIVMPNIVDSRVCGTGRRDGSVAQFSCPALATTFGLKMWRSSLSLPQSSAVSLTPIVSLNTRRLGGITNHGIS
jgi:hypothetical protein